MSRILASNRMRAAQVARTAPAYASAMRSWVIASTIVHALACAPPTREAAVSGPQQATPAIAASVSPVADAGRSSPLRDCDFHAAPAADDDDSDCQVAREAWEVLARLGYTDAQADLDAIENVGFLNGEVMECASRCMTGCSAPPLRAHALPVECSRAIIERRHDTAESIGVRVTRSGASALVDVLVPLKSGGFARVSVVACNGTSNRTGVWQIEIKEARGYVIQALRDPISSNQFRFRVCPRPLPPARP